MSPAAAEVVHGKRSGKFASTLLASFWAALT
jgi:hypothetical protein